MIFEEKIQRMWKRWRYYPIWRYLPYLPKIQCCGSGINIPDPSQEFKYFNPKNCFKAFGKMIRVVHPESGSWFFTHPGSRGQKKGTGSRIRNTEVKFVWENRDAPCPSYLTLCYDKINWFRYRHVRLFRRYFEYFHIERFFHPKKC